ncbi:hypothetical protein HX109_00780 [Galbibacter sp. BG1]|uniref:hypothetical protein n=1 Tax=Galbibacter sp. BG1 TaxID=1170699 RepID=UPI0015BC39FC|nr:hypothetical protein [Galbibacter sp. BG1]QLE00164.1 hypothetical protein HX109_00780 [Galbibacter sp. BG1]
MPIKSYIVLPYDGEKETLVKSLKSIAGCEVAEATNEEIILLVTDTQNEEEEELLKEKINGVKSLKFMSMVSGYSPENITSSTS